jgi:hypothetical protein
VNMWKRRPLGRCFLGIEWPLVAESRPSIKLIFSDLNDRY